MGGPHDRRLQINLAFQKRCGRNLLPLAHGLLHALLGSLLGLHGLHSLAHRHLDGFVVMSAVTRCCVCVGVVGRLRRLRLRARGEKRDAKNPEKRTRD